MATQEEQEHLDREQMRRFFIRNYQPWGDSCTSLRELQLAKLTAAYELGALTAEAYESAKAKLYGSVDSVVAGGPKPEPGPQPEPAAECLLNALASGESSTTAQMNLTEIAREQERRTAASIVSEQEYRRSLAMQSELEIVNAEIKRLSSAAGQQVPVERLGQKKPGEVVGMVEKPMVEGLQQPAPVPAPERLPPLATAKKFIVKRGRKTTVLEVGPEDLKIDGDGGKDRMQLRYVDMKTYGKTSEYLYPGTWSLQRGVVAGQVTKKAKQKKLSFIVIGGTGRQQPLEDPEIVFDQRKGDTKHIFTTDECLTIAGAVMAAAAAFRTHMDAVQKMKAKAAETERLAAERLAVEAKAEAERVAAEAKAEAERVAAEVLKRAEVAAAAAAAGVRCVGWARHADGHVLYALKIYTKDGGRSVVWRRWSMIASLREKLKTTIHELGEFMKPAQQLRVQAAVTNFPRKYQSVPRQLAAGGESEQALLRCSKRCGQLDEFFVMLTTSDALVYEPAAAEAAAAGAGKEAAVATPVAAEVASHPGAEWRGNCTLCGTGVWTDQPRSRRLTGAYVHDACLPQRNQESENLGLVEATDILQQFFEATPPLPDSVGQLHKHAVEDTRRQQLGLPATASDAECDRQDQAEEQRRKKLEEQAEEQRRKKLEEQAEEQQRRKLEEQAKEQRRRRQQEKREEIQRERQKIATIQKDVNELTTTVTSKALITPAGHYDQLESLDMMDAKVAAIKCSSTMFNKEKTKKKRWQR